MLLSFKNAFAFCGKSRRLGCAPYFIFNCVNNKVVMDVYIKYLNTDVYLLHKYENKQSNLVIVSNETGVLKNNCPCWVTERSVSILVITLKVFIRYTIPCHDQNGIDTCKKIFFVQSLSGLIGIKNDIYSSNEQRIGYVSLWTTVHFTSNAIYKKLRGGKLRRK